MGRFIYSHVWFIYSKYYFDRNCQSPGKCACKVQNVETYVLPHSPFPEMMRRNTTSNSQNLKSSIMEDETCSVNPMSLSSNSCSIAQERPLKVVMEENNKMRQAINNVTYYHFLSTFISLTFRITI